MGIAERIVQESLVEACFGLLLGQLTLLACWGAFSSQRWFLHIPRFVALCGWFLLVMFLGNYLGDGEGSKALVEELSSLTLSLLLAPSLMLFIAWRLITRRRFIAGTSNGPADVKSYQFGIARLLWITAEVAALLALARLVIPPTARWEEFWRAPAQLRWDELITGTAIFATIPVVYFGLARKQGVASYVILTTYLLLWSLGTACFVMEFQNRSPWGKTPEDWWAFGWQSLAIEFIPAFSLYLSATFTILITLWLVRRIGYDFRRRDEEGGGRRASNFRSSAASSSA